MVVALFFYLIVYAFYLVTFGVSTYLLAARRATARRRQNNWLFVTASFLMFLLLGIRTVCNIWIALRTLLFSHTAGSMQAGYAISLQGPQTIVNVRLYLLS